MIELKVGDIVDIKEFRKYDRKAKVTEIGKIRGGYFAGQPFVSAYQSWGDDHAPGSTAGHNFCFMRSVRNGEWIDLDNDTLLDPKYWPYLDNLFGYNKVTEAKTRKLKESIKKALKEDGRSFGQRFRMSKKDFEAWQDTTSKADLAYVRDLDGVKACYIDSFDKDYKRNMPKHIGTWNPETEELFCDDVSLFGHEVTENASSRLSKIFKTGKIEESSRVVINFDDSDEAKEFKEEMKKRFNYPKTTSRYQVVHGTSESGKSVFVESRGNKKVNKRLNEMFSSVEEENDAVENFCILMDWEVEPEDILHCVKNSDGKFTMQLNDGTQFTYDPVRHQVVSGKNVFVESRGNKKMKNRRVVEANSGFKPLGELLDSLVGPEDYADFLEYASDYGYDFEYEDPNAVWPVAEIQELVDCYYGDEDFGGYFGDPELHTEYDDETGDINLDMAYSDWIKSYAPNYDVSNEDAWRAGVELAGGIYDEASGQKYSEWVESFAPNYDISNEDAFTTGFKSIVEDPEIACFESATPYKERGVSYERRGR